MIANFSDIRDAAAERRAQRLGDAETWRMLREARTPRRRGLRGAAWTTIGRLLRARPAARRTPGRASAARY